MFYWHLTTQSACTTTGVNRLMQHIPAGAYTFLVKSWQLRVKSKSPTEHNSHCLPLNPLTNTLNPCKKHRKISQPKEQTCIFPPLHATLEDLMWQGLFAITGMQNKSERGEFEFNILPPSHSPRGSGFKPPRAALSPARLPINNN